MDFLCLPPEIIETILLKLDTQALAACALVDERLEKLIYSSPFLDEYCRKTFGCSWLTARDVHDAEIAVPYEFWFWVYKSVKTHDSHQGPIICQSQYLTRIGTLKHLFLMWLMCGYRSSFIDSHALMNVLYPLPQTVHDIFGINKKFPESYVIDDLMKVFLSLPEIMHVSCSNLKIFSMQKGGVVSDHSQILYKRLIPKLPEDFSPIFSVEMVCATSSARTPALMVLIAKDCWVLWFGLVYFSSPGPQSLENLHFGRYTHNVSVQELKLDAKDALKHFNECVQGYRDGGRGPSTEAAMKGVLCPIISFENSDIAYMTILLAQESFRTIQNKFEIILHKNCTALVKDVINIFKEQDNDRVRKNDKVMKLLNTKASQNNQIDDFVLKLIRVDLISVSLNSYHQMEFVIFKCILERIAFLFRNEIHKSLVNNFSHAFLCDCLGLSFPIKFCGNPELKIEKCLSGKLKDGLYSPQLWPPHVLSAACLILPALAEILKSDITLMELGRLKCALSANAIDQLNQKLRISGLTLTNRPPGKPRCPPVLKQVRILTIDNIEQTGQTFFC